MHTVELLPDAELDEGVRDLWSCLQRAGFPSLATHPHPTNRPHLTVISAASLTGLAPLALPIAAELGAARLLGRALVRAVTPTAELRDLQAAVWASLTGSDRWPPPAEWVPHVSLALRMPADRAEAALDLLASAPVVRGQFVVARSYDSRTRTVAPLHHRLTR
ncbi:2'-5' RNA ligase family protein [Actinoplanes sp. GCM10030250]|uniref:2'-5' RNA ligase family protein n=1 Tax=Actinoplanes sp. GCM10030250 TaxID=3273376 RepID=UPI0036197F1E